jgi:hypothetical protein
MSTAKSRRAWDLYLATVREIVARRRLGWHDGWRGGHPSMLEISEITLRPIGPSAHRPQLSSHLPRSQRTARELTAPPAAPPPISPLPSGCGPLPAHHPARSPTQSTLLTAAAGLQVPGPGQHLRVGIQHPPGTRPANASWHWGAIDVHDGPGQGRGRAADAILTNAAAPSPPPPLQFSVSRYESVRVGASQGSGCPRGCSHAHATHVPVHASPHHKPAIAMALSRSSTSSIRTSITESLRWGRKGGRLLRKAEWLRMVG